MSMPQDPQPAKLVVSVLFGDQLLAEPVRDRLEREFGPIELQSDWMDFPYTDYYDAEMGRPLVRKMYAFRDLIHQQDLSRVKLVTNAIEKEYRHSGGRTINIDPGYLLLERFVLATGKNFTHRIYIGGRIYADLTLIFQKGAFRTLPWTYPDYAAEDMHQFLNTVRLTYSRDLKAGRSG